MPFRRPPRPLSVLVSALATVGIMLAAAACTDSAPHGTHPASESMPPAGRLKAPIIVQVMRFQPPTPTAECPAGSVDLVGLELGVPRAAASAVPVGQGSPATPARSPVLLVGVACYRPVGSPVTITSAAVSSVTTYAPPPGVQNEPATYGFVVAFAAADVPAVTTVIRQAYDAGDAIGLTVAGKLWQAPQVRRPIAGRGAQITLLSRKQAFQLYRPLVQPG